MNVLLTGSNGFIGSYFINKYTSKHNIQTFSFINDDFETLDLNGIETIVHLSALVHQMGGASDTEYERVNVMQTLELARKAKALGVKHFVFMSTIKVYGEETDIAYSENTACNPEDEYGKSKLKAEKELQELKDNNFIISIIRTPIVYGYGVKANIKNLVNLVQKVSMLPFGSIDNQRSMVYIGNLCYLIDIVIEKQKGGVFLANDGEAISTTRLIELIAIGLGTSIHLIKIPFFESFLKFMKPSFHKRLYKSLVVDDKVTREYLGLEYPYSLENGIKLMLSGETK